MKFKRSGDGKCENGFDFIRIEEECKEAQKILKWKAPVIVIDNPKKLRWCYTYGSTFYFNKRATQETMENYRPVCVRVTLSPTWNPTLAPTLAPTKDLGCTRYNGEKVENGWNGTGTGRNYCNHCWCKNGEYHCSEAFCGNINQTIS